MLMRRMTYDFRLCGVIGSDVEWVLLESMVLNWLCSLHNVSFWIANLFKYSSFGMRLGPIVHVTKLLTSCLRIPFQFAIRNKHDLHQ